MAPPPADGSISVVIPTYNVRPYLDDFLDSLEAQGPTLGKVQLIFVDDGSTDGSGDRVKEWSATLDLDVHLITKPNGGLSSARNAGLDHASNEWVTFWDPDDVLGPGYVDTVTRFIRSERASGVDLVACNIVVLDDATGMIKNDHPLRFKFAKGERTIDLDRHPTNIHLQAASAFYRRSEIEAHELRFDHMVRPNFEDAHLTARYLSYHSRPRIHMLPAAHYHYRRRDDSLVRSSWSKHEKYSHVTRYGYLALLEELRSRLGRIPPWAQNLVLYDLLFYFREDERIHGDTGALPLAVTDKFHEVAERIVSMLDTEIIESFSITSIPYHMRRALIVGYKQEQIRPQSIAVVEIDPRLQLAKLRYYFGGDLPAEEFRSRGLVVRPVHSKTRAVRYLGRTMVYERIAWLSATGTIAAAIDGRDVPFQLGPNRPPDYLVGPTQLWRTLRSEAPPTNATTFRGGPGASQTSLLHRALRIARHPLANHARLRRRLEGIRHPLEHRQRWVRAVERRRMWLSHRPVVRRRFAGAWLLMDRDALANDNAEHLYRHLRAHHPEINSWFVLGRESPDWPRLEREGFRLLPYGSPRHAVAVSHAEHIVSSQVDHYVVRPFNRKRVRSQSYRFTFLQHGVTKDDLSRWVNGKPISLFITATADEHKSIAGDGTPYVFTTKEVKLTGFPRHDRLLALASAQRESARSILIMPTWRRDLLGQAASGGNERPLLDGFLSSTFAVNWLELTTSPALKAIAESANAQIVFMPHPNMESFLDAIELPSHVQVRRYSSVDVQEVLARGTLLVTDYSSQAFEMALLERPVVYYQFDREHFFSGGHAYRAGEWSYEDQGFGPVEESAEDVLKAIRDIVSNGWAPAPEHAARMDRTFKLRDGGASERVVQAILDLDRRLSYDEAYLRVDA